MSIVFHKPSERRVFLTNDQQNYFKIFHFVQKEAGDIYCHWPNFKETKWVSPTQINNGGEFRIDDTPPSSSKLSLHRSGIVKFKINYSSSDSSKIYGNSLMESDKSRIGPRHLFTCFMSEPKEKSEHSPFKKRNSDALIGLQHTSPFTLVFFAIPILQSGLEFNFKPSFPTEYFETDFSKDISMHGFSLGYHQIFCFAYRTKTMKHWPKDTCVFFHDGFYVPLFLGQKKFSNENHGVFNIKLQSPQYTLSEKGLTLELPFPEYKE